MDINAGIVDRQVNALVGRRRTDIVGRLGPQSAKDEHKIKSAAFSVLCLQHMLGLGEEAVLDCLTDGGNEAGRFHFGQSRRSLRSADPVAPCRKYAAQDDAMNLRRAPMFNLVPN